MAVYGKSDHQNFLAFDAELRAALAHEDVTAISMLVNYPLRINRPDGTAIALENPATLQAQFKEIFTPAVRAAVLAQKAEDIFCRYTGDFMYGDGVVWVNTVQREKILRYGIFTINVPPLVYKHLPPSGSYKIEFVCNAEKHRVVIDSDSAGKLRYRAWNKPRFLSEAPDLEITSGTMKHEGTNPCTAAIWAFKRGQLEYAVSEPGCRDDTMPVDAKGELTISKNGKEQAHWLCW